MHAVRKEEVRRSQRWKLPLEKCVWPGCVSRAPSYAPESLNEAGAPRPLPGGLEVLSPLQACSLLPLQGRAVPSKVGSPSSRAPSDPDTCSREPYPKQGDTLSVVGQETAPSPSPSHHSVELSSPAYGPTPRPPGGAAAPRDWRPGGRPPRAVPATPIGPAFGERAVGCRRQPGRWVVQPRGRASCTCASLLRSPGGGIERARPTVWDLPRTPFLGSCGPLHRTPFHLRAVSTADGRVPLSPGSLCSC